MRRTMLLLTAAAVMAAMLVVMAAPAMARGSEGVVRIDTFNRQLSVLPPNPIAEVKTIPNVLPPNPIYPNDPVRSPLENNPNVVSGECTLDDPTLCPD